MWGAEIIVHLGIVGLNLAEFIAEAMRHHRVILKLYTLRTLLSYLRDYQKNEITKLKELTFNRPHSELKR